MKSRDIVKSVTLAALLGATALTASAMAADGVATGDTSGKKIAFSNSYAGNAIAHVPARALVTRRMGSAGLRG